MGEAIINSINRGQTTILSGAGIFFGPPGFTRCHTTSKNFSYFLCKTFIAKSKISVCGLSYFTYHPWFKFLTKQLTIGRNSFWICFIRVPRKEHGDESIWRQLSDSLSGNSTIDTRRDVRQYLHAPDSSQYTFDRRKDIPAFL